ncbi:MULTISPECIES: histidinol-phosphatase [unclassified Brevundimonas]|uniref:histidinol-phosphatase n=1 Tax=unclassified Brevundimonas TaxID=2622653 RepID=UPI0006FAD9F1|nr:MULTISPECIES: histidinol-phosphatase [unclassified Brevundimonas]KQY90846.1 inositol monophosphatase [Brevundimonas sp. Root1423]KRA28445.1 inositol monophosphatase [Brevundimonas sp. Root608]
MTEYELFAVELAREAARVSLPYFRGDYAQSDKGGAGAFDPVTEADQEAEAALRRLIAARYPDHGVIGEEYGEDRPDADHVWILDPIDGTRAFIAGLPLWTNLIALRAGGRPAVGVIAQPYLDEIFLGGPSGARLLRGDTETALAVRPCPRLNDALIATTDPDLFTGAELGAWTQVRAAARLARLGCDAYAYAMLAAGRIDLVAESALKVWDWSALVPVIEAAGGAVSNWRGEAPDGSGQILAVGDVGIREQALVTLRRAAV